MISRKLYLGAILLISALLLASCDSLIGTSSSVDERRAPANSLSTNEANFEISPQEECEPQVFTLWAGQSINSGTVTITNDDYFLYVKFETTGDWLLKETQVEAVSSVDALPLAGSGRPIPGQFTYKEDHNYITYYEYEISLDELDYDVENPLLVIATHAVVVKLDEDGHEIDSETGWGGDIPVNVDSPGAWWYYGTYMLQYDCDDDNGDNGEVCFKEDTAWSDGYRYTPRGNWATYTEVDGEDIEVSLFAGQTKDIGTVSFEHDGEGNVTITIHFNDGAGLQDVEEAVKIQGYDYAPSGNPAPGGFTTYKGNELEITVAAYKYFGVHIDSKREVECE
ncbi:MAG: hypothetical protein LAT84_01405 [Balneolia bacterium]|nr:hypothetical protein [Balneolia bacterium]